MKRCRDILQSANFHLYMSYVWMLMLVPTLLWWKSSILWVAAMSLYANFVGHWSAYQAKRAEHMGNGSTESRE